MLACVGAWTTASPPNSTHWRPLTSHSSKVSSPASCSMGAPSGSGPTSAGSPRAVGFAKGVAASTKYNRHFVIRCHPSEHLTKIASRRQRIGVAVRPFRADVDQARLHCREGIKQFSVAAVTPVAKPGGLGSPVDVLASGSKTSSRPPANPKVLIERLLGDWLFHDAAVAADEVMMIVANPGFVSCGRRAGWIRRRRFLSTKTASESSRRVFVGRGTPRRPRALTGDLDWRSSRRHMMSAQTWPTHPR